MELVSIPRRNRTRIGGNGNDYNEPFLNEEPSSGDVFVDEFDLRDESGFIAQRRGRHRRRPLQFPQNTFRSSAHPIVKVSNYRPPSLPHHNAIVDGHIVASGSKMNNNLSSMTLQQFNAPSPSTTSDRYHQQQPRQVRSHSGAFSDVSISKNPAIDLGGGFLSTGCLCCQCVRTQEVAITENFGRFEEVVYQPGFYCMAWPFANISGRLSLRIQQLDVVCETKTKDNVFIDIQVSVQFRVIPDRVFDAYYRLTDPKVQIRTCVYDVIRSAVPRLTLDEAFSSTFHVAESVLNRLQPMMRLFGFEIVDSLVTNISPDSVVKASMNEINASKKIKEAMPHKAEAQKIVAIKRAEGAAQHSFLSGVGTARQRSALTSGMKESMSDWMNEQEISSKEVFDILLVSQYLDMLGAIGSSHLVLRHIPDKVLDICDNARTQTVIPDLLS
mmetsp:Transcript_11261/g.17421  ORF Transcript_11261/g.17421 Transcript_11261/m.17421 type:complete len:442 (+) Transcript_11261:36-1361(+)